MKYIAIVFGIFLFLGCKDSPKNPIAKEEEADKKPNIVYILADDLGYGDLSIYGQEKFDTPNIDRLAAKGMMFTQHYSGSTVCAPSRTSLLTGLHTGHSPIRGNQEWQPEGQYPLPEEAFTLTEMLKQAGYVTGAFGKWGLGYNDTSGNPLKQGFDTFFGYLCQAHAHRYYPPHLWHDKEKIQLPGNDGTNTATYAPDVIQKETLDFIEKNRDTTFFLYVPSVIPHAELIAPQDSILERFSKKFDPKPWGFDNTTANGHKGNAYGSENFLDDGYAPVENPHAVFAAMITRLDHQVGEIVAKLDELGLSENTLVIFTSDNGPHEAGGADPDFFEGFGKVRGYKRDLYEGGIRVPMIAKWPAKIKAGGVSDHVCAFWDVMPTLAEITGTQVPDTIDGISFLSTLLGNKEEQRQHEYLYWEFDAQGGKQTVRMGDWKGVRLNVKENPNAPIELYDLSKDIKELNNVANEHSATVYKIDSIMKVSHLPNPDFPLYPGDI